jgi:hypothetical protein
MSQRTGIAVETDARQGLPNFDVVTNLARSAGIEPTTPGFGVQKLRHVLFGVVLNKLATTCFYKNVYVT